MQSDEKKRLAVAVLCSLLGHDVGPIVARETVRLVGDWYASLGERNVREAISSLPFLHLLRVQASAWYELSGEISLGYPPVRRLLEALEATQKTATFTPRRSAKWGQRGDHLSHFGPRRNIKKASHSAFRRREEPLWYVELRRDIKRATPPAFRERAQQKIADPLDLWQATTITLRAPIKAQQINLGASRDEEVQPEPSLTRVTVYFGTNRERLLKDAMYGASFSGNRSAAVDPLSLGFADVTIPHCHKEGRIERPSFLRFEFSENPDKHMIIEKVVLYDEDTWTKSLAGRADEALLFVHGFNVTFEDALFRAAQIAYDLRFPGVPLCFSWASRGEVLDYPVDEGTVGWSALHLRRFLELIATKLDIKRVHVIAHSMGNRAVLSVLQSWTPLEGQAQLDQLILAAPDVDAGEFAQCRVSFGRFERATLYASSNDRPLQISRGLHAYARAGDASPPIVLDGLDTIDASKAGAEMFGLGHSYFASKAKIFSDLFYLIWHGLPPPERASLRHVAKTGYYELAD